MFNSRTSNKITNPALVNDRSALKGALYVFRFIIPIVAFVAARIFIAKPVMPWQMNYVAVLFLAFGFVLLAKAKSRLIRVFVSNYGIPEMNVFEKRFYVFAYMMFLIAVMIGALTE